MRRRGATVDAPAAEGIEVEGQFFADPFDIPAALSPKLQPDQYRDVFRIIEARYSRLIRKASKGPGPRALLLCDRKIVAEATTPEEFGLDEIRQIEARHDSVCFIYSSGDLVEECAWSSVGAYDAYPTLRVWVAPEGAPQATLLYAGAEVVADFGTGNPRHPRGFCAFDDSVRKDIGIPPGVHAQASHLGASYWYTGVPALVATRDGLGQTRAHRAAVRFVPDWESSPLVWANPSRRGLVGREVLFGLRLRVLLDAAARQTTIGFA